MSKSYFKLRDRLSMTRLGFTSRQTTLYIASVDWFAEAGGSYKFLYFIIIQIQKLLITNSEPRG